MKRLALATLALLSLAACNNGLNDKDRAMMKETHDLAVSANEKADRAEANSRANAAASAQSADKADRIFRAGQNK
jgi:hypothetical protein